MWGDSQGFGGFGSNTGWGGGSNTGWGGGQTQASTGWGGGFGSQPSYGGFGGGFGSQPSYGGFGGFGGGFGSQPSYGGFGGGFGGGFSGGFGGGFGSQPSYGGFGQTQAPTGFGNNWMGNQNLAPMTNQMGTPFSSGFGFGYQGAYGPTGDTTGQDLSKMAYTYGKDPQALAAQMQYEGVTPWNMQQAGVIGNQQYTQMFRPSSQSQSKLNTNQYYQPIQQSQYQNYASPYYYGLANANNMGAYNALSQANMGPAIGLASQSAFNPYTNTFSTPYGQAYGGLGSVIGSYATPFALAQQQAALNPYGNTAYMGGYGGYTQPKAGTTDTTSDTGGSKDIISNINTGNTSTGTTNLGTAKVPTYGANNLSARDFLNSIGDYTKNTAQQNFDLAMKNNLSLQDISDLTGMSQQEVTDYFKKSNLDASNLKGRLQGTAYDPNKTYDDATGTATDTATDTTTQPPEKQKGWYTNKDYNYADYKNYTSQDLSGFTKDQINKLYATKLQQIKADIKQATDDYTAASTSGDPARVRWAQANLDAQNAELAQYNLDYGAATKALTGAKGTYETPEMTAARLDTTALGKLDAAAKKYTAYKAPTIKEGSNSATINSAYKNIITTQQTEMNNAKKALDAAVGPKEKEAAQKYYDAQKAEYDKATADQTKALSDIGAVTDDKTAVSALDKAAKAYTAYNAPTIKDGSNAAAINKAYSGIITKQQTEMNNAQKALDAAVGPLAKAAAQRYYDTQKAEYDKAQADLNKALEDQEYQTQVDAANAESAKISDSVIALTEWGKTLTPNNWKKFPVNPKLSLEDNINRYDENLATQKSEMEEAKKRLDNAEYAKTQSVARDLLDQQTKDYNDALAYRENWINSVRNASYTTYPSSDMPINAGIGNLVSNTAGADATMPFNLNTANTTVAPNTPTIVQDPAAREEAYQQMLNDASNAWTFDGSTYNNSITGEQSYEAPAGFVQAAQGGLMSLLRR